MKGRISFLHLPPRPPALQDVFRENQAMPTERFRAAAVNVTEYVYLFGGRNASGVLVSRGGGAKLLSYYKRSVQLSKISSSIRDARVISLFCWVENVQEG